MIFKCYWIVQTVQKSADVGESKPWLRLEISMLRHQLRVENIRLRLVTMACQAETMVATQVATRNHPWSNSITRNCDCESGYDSQPKAAQPETAQLRVLLRLATTLNGLRIYGPTINGPGLWAFCVNRWCMIWAWVVGLNLWTVYVLLLTEYVKLLHRDCYLYVHCLIWIWL